MSEIYVCPICGMTLHNCVHSIEEMVKFDKSQLGLAVNEIDVLITERDLLREQLDVAMKALEYLHGYYNMMVGIFNEKFGSSEYNDVAIENMPEYVLTEIAKLGEKK